MSAESKRTPVVKKKQSSENLNSFSALASLSLSRDSLNDVQGMLKSQREKKVFTPNLNVARNKNLNVKTSATCSKNYNNRGRTNAGRGRNNRECLVQTTGVFSEGIGGHKKSSSSSSFRYENSSSDSLRKPTLNKKDNKSTFNSNKHNLNDILDDDLNDEEELESQKSDLKYVPIKLSDKNDHISQSNLKSSLIKNPKSVREFFDDGEPKFFLMQLPDNLPCQNSTNQLDEKGISSCENNKDNTLNELEEGQIGKLLRYKSGKFKLVLGNTYFDLQLGIKPEFLQEIISINTNREERSGSMISLGTIQAKFSAIPDWENLFKNNVTS